jgi:hypothetical protein
LSDEETKRTSLVIGRSTDKNARHLAVEVQETLGSRFNFSGLTRGLLKGMLFLIGDKDWSDTTKTQIVTLCDDPSQAPVIMIEWAKTYYENEYPELLEHFKAILSILKERT